MGILTGDSDPIFDRMRKKLPQVSTPEDAGTREYYILNRDATQNLIRQIWTEIPIEQRVPGSLVPRPDLEVMLPKQARRKMEGSHDYAAIGRCGETAVKCGLLYQDGYRACTGVPVRDERGMVVKMGTPCPYYKAGIKLPYTKGRIMADAAHR